MTASTNSSPSPQAPGHDTDDRTRIAAVDPPTSTIPAARPATKQPRTITVRIAAIIATVAFLVGLGVSMLLGPVLGGPGGTPPTGGPGGAPGASTSQSATTGT